MIRPCTYLLISLPIRICELVQCACILYIYVFISIVYGTLISIDSFILL